MRYISHRTFARGAAVTATGDVIKVPVVDGQSGILAGHSNLITAVVPGELTYTVPGEEPLTVACAGGLMKVEDNDVLILVDYLLRADEIDADRTREEAAAARELLLRKRSRQEYLAAQTQLARAVAKLKVRKDHAHTHRT